LAVPPESKAITLIAAFGAVYVDMGDDSGGAKRVLEKFKSKIIF
jgi:hypothetical protein